MKVSGRILETSIDFKSGKPSISLEIDDKNVFLAEIDDLRQAEKVSVEIKKFKKTRSLDANAYCWVLCDKLAERLNITKNEVYRTAIQNIGGVSETLCVKEDAAENFKKIWESRGVGWVAECFPSKINGCVNVTAYYGSSAYSSAQMSRLIDLLIRECEEQGIATITNAEYRAMIGEWNK